MSCWRAASRQSAVLPTGVLGGGDISAVEFVIAVVGSALLGRLEADVSSWCFLMILGLVGFIDLGTWSVGSRRSVRVDVGRL